MENSDESEIYSNINDFDSFLDNINQNPSFDQINELIDEAPMIFDSNSFDSDNKSSLAISTYGNLCKILFCDIILDLLAVFFLLVNIIFRFSTTIVLISEVFISFYSVIIMNYVFFVSSIVSYAMSPIYQSLSSDWLNFTFSFAQVILSSPLIAFYIIYIIKSVINLGEFISDIPSYFGKVFLKHWKIFKKEIFSCLATNYKKTIFTEDQRKKIFIKTLKSIFFQMIIVIIEYTILYVDKAIIAIGMVSYIINTLQIMAFILPSYLYFFQTLFNIKCKEVKYVKKFINKSKEKLKEFKPDSESGSEKSDESNSEKIVDDEYITVFKVDEVVKEFDNIRELKYMILNLLLAQNYFSLYSYSKFIAFDKHEQIRKRIFMYIFFVLNLIEICYDYYQLAREYSDYFLASVIIRTVFIPLFAFYNIFTITYRKAKDNILKNSIIASTIFTVLIIILIFLCSAFIKIYRLKFRIGNLDYVPPYDNITIANENGVIHPFCLYDLYNVSTFDAFGYSLGGYDIKRNRTIYENQMKIFFGENYSSHISHKIYELDQHFLFLKYYDSSVDTHIFAFRGYNSGPELAFQFELFVGFYVIPFFEDNVPFYGFLNDYWLSFYTDFMNSFGLRFFENNNLIVKYVKSIIEIYENESLNDHERVIFSGINCGGVIAKIVGTLLHRKSISFLSFPLDIDFIQHLFEFSTFYTSYITNVFNVDGWFSHPDSNYAVNIGIDTPIFIKRFLCTSGFCDFYSRTDNVYQSFCTMAELCGKANQFNYYCENTIGKKDIDIIRNHLKDEE